MKWKQWCTCAFCVGEPKTTRNGLLVMDSTRHFHLLLKKNPYDKDNVNLWRMKTCPFMSVPPTAQYWEQIQIPRGKQYIVRENGLECAFREFFEETSCYFGGGTGYLYRDRFHLSWIDGKKKWHYNIYLFSVDSVFYCKKLINWTLKHDLNLNCYKLEFLNVEKKNKNAYKKILYERKTFFKFSMSVDNYIDYLTHLKYSSISHNYLEFVKIIEKFTLHLSNKFMDHFIPVKIIR
nr:hypothetical protein [Microctonus hyperodae filamentous virus]